MQHVFDFDTQLPELASMFDRDLVIRRFEQRWPSTEPAPRSIQSCRLQDTKYQPHQRCTTTYQLQIEQHDGSVEQTIGVLEMTSQGVAHRLYREDTELPWLQEAADPLRMRERFATLLQESGSVVTGCRVTPVRYRAGARCVFRYEVACEDGQRVFFGKLLGGESGETDRLVATLEALHKASLASHNMPLILPPLAYWADLHMLIQPEVSGQAELNDLGFDPSIDPQVRNAWLLNAGRSIAAFHHTVQVGGPSRSLDEDIDELEEYLAPMQIVDHALAARYAGELTKLRRLARAISEPLGVASHGAFRTDQFLIEGDRLVMIDLDGFCWSNPARDLGNYRGYLRWKHIRRPDRATLIEQADRCLLDGYGQLAQVPHMQELALYQAASMLKIAGRRFRSLTMKEWSLVPALVDAAAALLDG